MSEEQFIFTDSLRSKAIRSFKCTQSKPYKLKISDTEWASAEATVVYNAKEPSGWWAGIDLETYAAKGLLARAVRDLGLDLLSVESPTVRNGQVNSLELNTFLQHANVELSKVMQEFTAHLSSHGAQLLSSSDTCPAITYSGLPEHKLSYPVQGSENPEVINPVIWSSTDTMPEVRARKQPSESSKDTILSDDIRLPNGSIVPKARWQFSLSQKVSPSTISGYLRSGQIPLALTKVRQGLVEVLLEEMPSQA